ncbi:helix-turn-helix domain-containing protein [Micromonospora sp. NPDC007271]|uniref:TetR/AcrR family transcriptional regulator n=1 Tax=Micromonospora sp. NPDC007271 TaxID=3154587 RepID=UPI0033C27350
MGRPPAAESGDTRAAVLDAALALFARHGFAGTSVRAIARAVGLSDAALYRHFPSKQAIFDEVLRQAGAGLLTSTLAGIDAALAEQDPPALLRAVAEALIRAWDEPRARQIASVVARALGDTHVETITATMQVRDQLAALFRRWIDQGHVASAKGSPDQLAWELFAPSAYVRLLYLHAEADAATRLAGHELVRRHLEFFIDTVFNGTDDKETR